MARFAIFLFSVILLLHHLVTSQGDDEFTLSEQKTALLYFKGNVTLTPKYQDSWKESEDLCKWNGVHCIGSVVVHLRLPGAVKGEIPPETIGKLLGLKVLSLRFNSLYGHLPDDFSNLTSLETLALNNNKFSGPLPNMKLKCFNFSVNNFNGSIPKLLSKSSPSLFSFNPYLCGDPIGRPCPKGTQPVEPPKEETQEKKAKDNGVIVGVSVASALLVLILLSCLKKKKINKQRAGMSIKGERDKLEFLEAGVYTYDLRDLYHRASHEILGKGCVGTSYKVVMDGGTTVVVKQLKDVVVTKNEFESRMKDLGKTKNQHLITLKAFYCSNDEKLAVYDYLPAGSLSARLHGSKGSGQTVLDWRSRMRIALSAARGIEYLHEVEKMVHGNIKSSNILLEDEDEDEINAFVSDFGLNTLVGPNHLVPGYLALEVFKQKELTFESDVYSFGVLLLELLTGKAPNQDNTNVQKEWMADVFDVELMTYQHNELEMVQLKELAMNCVSILPNQRPLMHQVVRKMEDIMNQAEFDHTSVGPSERSDSHTPSTSMEIFTI